MALRDKLCRECSLRLINNPQRIDAIMDALNPAQEPSGQPWDFILSDDEWRTFGLGRFNYVSHLKNTGRVQFSEDKWQWTEIAKSWASLKALPLPIALSWRPFIKLSRVPPQCDFAREHARMRRDAYQVWCTIPENTHRTLWEMVVEQLDRAFP